MFISKLLLAVSVLGLAVAGAQSARAGERKLGAAEIAEALTGNTVDGVWGGTAYRSYFDPSGVTLYQPKGRPPERGKWKVDEAGDRYCSWWERSGWSCYELYRDGATIIWQIPGTATRHPSTLLTGRQL